MLQNLPVIHWCLSDRDVGATVARTLCLEITVGGGAAPNSKNESSNLSRSANDGTKMPVPVAMFCSDCRNVSCAMSRTNRPYK